MMTFLSEDWRRDYAASGSSEVEADNALDAAMAVSDCAYVEQGQTFEIIKSEPIKTLRPHRIYSKRGYSADRYKLIGKAMKALKNDSGAFEW